MSNAVMQVERRPIGRAEEAGLPRWLASWWMVPILAYHRVGEPQADHVPTVTPERFEAQLAFIAQRGYQVCGLSEVADGLALGGASLRRKVVITFDDGYAETCTVAAPMLRRFGFSATVFIAPGEIGLPGFLSWEQLREIGRDVFTVGSHTMHHTYLPLVGAAKVRQELGESKRILEERLGAGVEWVSYPVGGYTVEVQALARQAGYRGACTTNRGVSKRAKDLFALRRIKITERDSHPALLSVKLSGYYDVFRALKAPA